MQHKSVKLLSKIVFNTRLNEIPVTKKVLRVLTDRRTQEFVVTYEMCIRTQHR